VTVRLDADLPALDEAAGRLSMAFGRLARVLRRGTSAGLGAGSLSALATVVRHGPIRLGDLAVREGVQPPTLSRIVAHLEDSGLLVRSPDPTDRRATRAEATPAGVDLISGTGSSRAGVLHARMAALSPEDLAILLRAVPVLEALAADEN
jgi:DNA-binding MarR family transcriptional regulator